MSADNYALIFKKNDVYRIAILQDSWQDPKKVTLEECMDRCLDGNNHLLFSEKEEAREYYYLAETELSECGSMLTEYGLLGLLRDFDA